MGAFVGNLLKRTTRNSLLFSEKETERMNWLRGLWYGKPTTDAFSNVGGGGGADSGLSAEGTKAPHEVQAELTERVRTMRIRAAFQRKKAADVMAQAQEAMRRKPKADRATASRLVKRSKVHERNASVLEQQADNLEQTGMVLDSASIQADTAAVLRDGLHTGQRLMSEVSVEEVVDVTLDWTALSSDVRDVGRELSKPFDLGLDEPDWEEEIDAELDQMADGAQLEHINALFDSLPDAPTRDPLSNNDSNGGPGTAEREEKQAV